MTQDRRAPDADPAKGPVSSEGPATSGSEAALRTRAEEEARRRAALARPSLEDLSRDAAERVLHELQVHQIELEMQNAELRAAQDALAASRERYFRLYDLAPVGYLTLDADGLIVDANLTAAALVRVDRASLLRAPWTRFIGAADQDTYYLKRRAALSRRAGFSCDLRLVVPAANPRWVRMDVTPVPGGAAGDMSCWATLTDITESRHLAAELEHAQRMKAVGTLASGVAHEFNNMLAVIMGHAELLLETLPPGVAAADDVTAIATAAKRARDIARQLLAYGRKQDLSPRAFDLHAAATDLERTLRTHMRGSTSLRYELSADVAAPYVDPARLEQVLVNLVINARDALGGGGEVVIRADNVEVHAPSAAGDGLAPGAYVRLRIADNGAGIPADVLPHLFEPFFTTKAFGQGTGLGLAIVHGIVTQSGGRIEVESELGRGTTFTILLPRSAAPVLDAAAPGPERTPAARRFTGRALVVDDVAQLRAFMRRLLVRLGFEVDDAASGQQALELFAADPGRYRIVVTDVSMPGMDGPTLARSLVEKRPGLKVLFMTGYLDVSEGPGGAVPEGARLLTKPFGAAELEAALADLLGERG